MGVSELEQCRQRFEKIAEQAKALTAGLSEAQFNWRPGPGQWSMEECFGHLVIVGQYEMKLLEPAVEEARARSVTGSGPFRYGFLERTILRASEPSSPRKFRSPRRFCPVHGQPLTAILPTFLHLQSQFLRMVEQSEGLDLARVKVATPITRWFKFSLGIVLAQQAAHEHRHMEQARRVREHPQFPGRP